MRLLLMNLFQLILSTSKQVGTLSLGINNGSLGVVTVALPKEADARFKRTLRFLNPNRLSLQYHQIQKSVEVGRTKIKINSRGGRITFQENNVLLGLRIAHIIIGPLNQPQFSGDDEDGGDYDYDYDYDHDAPPFYPSQNTTFLIEIMENTTESGNKTVSIMCGANLGDEGSFVLIRFFIYYGSGEDIGNDGTVYQVERAFIKMNMEIEMPYNATTVDVLLGMSCSLNNKTKVSEETTTNNGKPKLTKIDDEEFLLCDETQIKFSKTFMADKYRMTAMHPDYLPEDSSGNGEVLFKLRFNNSRYISYDSMFFIDVKKNGDETNSSSMWILLSIVFCTFVY